MYSAEHVVHRKPNVPTAELTVHGVPGDLFSYEVIKSDDSTTTGHSEFGPGQRRAVFTTGVPNVEINNIQISARGRVGTPGTCVISTIEQPCDDAESSLRTAPADDAQSTP